MKNKPIALASLNKDAPIYIQESWINRTEGLRNGKTDVYETGFAGMSKGAILHKLMRFYGRCVSKVYINSPDGTRIPIGYVFQKKENYADTREEYLLETWVTFHAAPEFREFHYNYLNMG